jgi:ubiquinone/menaquinone biosynthesis C-methylase UbiE
MSYVFMKVLESSPSRYDRGINLITLGRISEVYDRLASHIKNGWIVIDIGCGTGAMTLRAAHNGARVVGIDVNPQMLEIAGKRLQKMGLSGSVKLREQGVAELSTEPAAQYDAAICSLVFSELTEDERVYTLCELRRLLKPGGLLLIASETRPSRFFKRLLYWLIRIPLVILTYALTQTSTSAVKNLPAMVDEAGFIMEEVRYSWLGDLTELVCRNPKI